MVLRSIPVLDNTTWLNVNCMCFFMFDRIDHAMFFFHFWLHIMAFSDGITETNQRHQPAGHARLHAWAANLANGKRKTRKSFFGNRGVVSKKTFVENKHQKYASFVERFHISKNTFAHTSTGIEKKTHMKYALCNTHITYNNRAYAE